MRTLTISLISAIGAFALSLTFIAYPTEEGAPLSHWALTVGAFSSASLISFIYILAALISPPNHQKSQMVVLVTFFICLIIATVTGAVWGVVGHIMETENLDFEFAFQYVAPIVYAGYGITAAIFSITLFYLNKQRKNKIKGQALEADQ